MQLTLEAQSSTAEKSGVKRRVVANPDQPKAVVKKLSDLTTPSLLTATLRPPYTVVMVRHIATDESVAKYGLPATMLLRRYG
ncbi:hypothetical protein RJT34_24954 [Clitoria ternatea]|uniref:Uncharacterized protein n=1 Tax=Clitoria ternatea TaxID=43366 RepID=A0AAN9IJM2_CLITE